MNQQLEADSIFNRISSNNLQMGVQSNLPWPSSNSSLFNISNNNNNQGVSNGASNPSQSFNSIYKRNTEQMTREEHE